ncbi:hypothetical protein GCM10023147_46810 [Tsukamurella soli]|uniref:CobW C-terminal domain-containing protein n=1 Tax=Tsukamurella soli TaxID=644556 RepID=A0ABP8KDW4_9ACTN
MRLLDVAARRPFHPGRLHEAVDVLLDGVVTARGRLWLATRPDAMLWLESAGAGLRVGLAGPWDACTDPLLWDETHGPRHSSLVVLVAGADPEAVIRALEWALVTDAEFAAGPRVWAGWDDPFGNFHVDPCETEVLAESTRETTKREGAGE